jgi:hypothetical protein
MSIEEPFDMDEMLLAPCLRKVQEKPDYDIFLFVSSLTLEEFFLMICGYNGYKNGIVLKKTEVFIMHFRDLLGFYEDVKRDVGGGKLLSTLVEGEHMITPVDGLNWVIEYCIPISDELRAWLDKVKNCKAKTERYTTERALAADIAKKYWKKGQTKKEVATYVKDKLVTKCNKKNFSIKTIEGWIQHLDRRSPESKTGPKKK